MDPQPTSGLEEDDDVTILPSSQQSVPEDVICLCDFPGVAPSDSSLSTNIPFQDAHTSTSEIPSPSVDVTCSLADESDPPDQRLIRRIISICFYLAVLIALVTGVVAMAVSMGYNPSPVRSLTSSSSYSNDTSVPALIDISTLISNEEKSSSCGPLIDPSQSSGPLPSNHNPTHAMTSHLIPSVISPEESQEVSSSSVSYSETSVELDETSVVSDGCRYLHAMALTNSYISSDIIQDPDESETRSGESYCAVKQCDS